MDTHADVHVFKGHLIKVSLSLDASDEEVTFLAFSSPYLPVASEDKDN